ncbi:MAG: hypothetical protein DMG22_10580, partial [Acidobacteria bacterium]
MKRKIVGCVGILVFFVAAKASAKPKEQTFSVTQAATASANREVKVLIEGKEVDALELLQKLNARGAKKHLNFVETKEGFDFRIKVDITTTTKLGEPG